MSPLTSVALGEVAEFVRGITFTPNDVAPLGTPDTVACMRTKNVQAELDLSDVWAVSRRFVKRDEQFLKPGDVLVSSANSWNLVGKASWVPALAWPSSFGGFVTVLRAKLNAIEARYLYWWFVSDQVQALLRSFGQQTTNISNLNLARCLALGIPLPSLPEQRRISEMLDRAAALRAKRHAALGQLDTLTQSIFLEMFGDPAINPNGWTWRTLGDLITVGPQNGLYKPADKYGTGTPILRIDAFYDGVVTKLTSLKRVRLSAAEETLYALRVGEIVINRVNSREYLGKSALIPTLTETTVFESNMMRFDVDRELLDPGYLIQYLQTSFVRAHILRSTKDAINQSSVNQQDVKAIPVVVPPLATQRLYSQRLAAISRLKDSQDASSIGLQALFVSLQDRAFRGELFA